MLFGGHRGLVQIYLPVHQSAGHQEFLYGIDSLHLHHQSVIAYIEHLQQSFTRHATFLHTCEERIAAEIVHTINVQLTRDKLVQEMLRILVLKDRNCGVQLTIQVNINPLHHQKRDIFVRHTFNECMLKHMRERSVTDIVQQDGNHRARLFVLRDFHAFETQRSDSLVHQMHRAQRVAETAVHCTRIYQVRQAQLANTI